MLRIASKELQKLVLSLFCAIVFLAFVSAVSPLSFSWSWAIALGAVAYVVYSIKKMAELAEWLETYIADDTDLDQLETPEGSGLWRKIFDLIHQSRRENERAFNALESVIDRARASTDALDDAIVLINGQNALEWWNKSAEVMLGFRITDSGQLINNLLRDPKFIAYLDRGDYSDPLEVYSPLNTTQLLQLQVTTFGDNDRLLLIRDITRLSNLEQIQKDFVANVSHELRTPLTVIRGYLETFLDHSEQIPANWHRALTQMDEQTERMQNLVTDLLTLSKLEAGHAHRDRQRVSMRALLVSIEREAKAQADKKQQHLHLDVIDGMDVMGNELELHSAVSNLVFNAIKYTQVGGSVDIAWHHDSVGAYLTVSDNGVGIDEKHFPRLTERFYRADSSRHSSTGGTGLGLSIVKHVLANHGAELKISSKVGHGSEFKCVFPPATLLQLGSQEEA